MKKRIILLVLCTTILFSCFKQSAQSSLADPKDELLLLKKNYADEIIKQLKATKTVFFYKKDNSPSIDSIKKAISSAWNLTPIIFDDIEKFQSYATNPEYSYFIIEGVTTTTSSSTGTYSNTHYYLTLRLFKEVSKKGKVKTTGLCRIELYPNFETMEIGANGGNAEKVITTLYNRGVFYNWSPILLKAQLASVSTNLKNNTRPWLFEDIKDDNLTHLLSKDTLYVPQSLLIGFNAFTGKEKNKSENVFSSYRYKYRICSDSELFNIFETEKRGRLLFEYVKSSTDKFISVYDLKEKKIIYKKYTPISYNLKSKDIAAIE
jgi:hypothetical protein